MTPHSFASHQIGDFQVTVLSDGDMTASLELLNGITPSEAGQIQREAGITAPGNIHINGYLIRGQGKTLLVDSGSGGWNNIEGLVQAQATRQKILAQAASEKWRVAGMHFALPGFAHIAPQEDGYRLVCPTADSL
ncbi:hypothetical protein AAIG39_02615 [Phytobacter palmae]|uniref:MBL fold metallo-hydrolase n=1 Tax=Phytobacter palmae TaxID=1855371 RepID=A0ABU9UZV0_9ENTR